MTATVDRRLEARLGLLLCLYVAEGLPSGLCTEALPAILSSYGVAARYIGLAGMLLVPWSCKFLWASRVDAWCWPRVGHRRSWIIPCQLTAACLMAIIAHLDPHRVLGGSGLLLFLGILLVINTLGATHDVATDGLAVRILAPGERSMGNAIQVAGYRAGLVGGGGLLLVCLGKWGWQAAFLSLAALILLLLMPVLVWREPPAPAQRGPDQHRFAVVLRSFLRQPGMNRWVAVLLMAKAGDYVGNAMLKPWLIASGFTLGEVGTMVSIIGCTATLAGALTGGWLIRHLPRLKAMALFYGLQGSILCSYGFMAHHSFRQAGNHAVLYMLNALDHAVSGMATALILTMVMDHTRPGHAGADFSFQVSLMTMGGGTLYLLSGFATEALGFSLYFSMCGIMTLAMLVAMIRLTRGLPVQVMPKASHA